MALRLMRVCRKHIPEAFHDVLAGRRAFRAACHFAGKFRFSVGCEADAKRTSLDRAKAVAADPGFGPLYQSPVNEGPEQAKTRCFRQPCSLDHFEQSQFLSQCWKAWSTSQSRSRVAPESRIVDQGYVRCGATQDAS